MLALAVVSTVVMVAMGRGKCTRGGVSSRGFEKDGGREISGGGSGLRGQGVCGEARQGLRQALYGLTANTLAPELAPREIPRPLSFSEIMSRHPQLATLSCSTATTAAATVSAAAVGRLPFRDTSGPGEVCVSVLSIL